MTNNLLVFGSPSIEQAKIDGIVAVMELGGLARPKD
jgi:hypothetical protein